MYKFYHENENKTVFTWTKYQDFMNIASVDWIQKDGLVYLGYFKHHNVLVVYYELTVFVSDNLNYKNAQMSCYFSVESD